MHITEYEYFTLMYFQLGLRELFKTPGLLKHRIILALIYSTGLRSREVINLKLFDIDFERKTIHIRQSKYKKDRIVPLSNYIAKGLWQNQVKTHYYDNKYVINQKVKYK